jgi:hypothetical protein
VFSCAKKGVGPGSVHRGFEEADAKRKTSRLELPDAKILLEWCFAGLDVGFGRKIRDAAKIF